MRIEREDALLLARNANFPMPFFSVIAGFVDAGETLEECVHREAKEELGVELTDLEYLGSQAWPFPHSLMVAFRARWLRGEVQVDGHEIAEARWVRWDALPLVPPKVSLSGQIIEDFFLVQKRREEALSASRGYCDVRSLRLRNGAEVVLRPLRKDDAAGLLAHETALVHDHNGQGMVLEAADLPESAEAYAEELSQRYLQQEAVPTAVAFVAEHAGRIVGEISVRRLRPSRVRHVGLIGLGVSPAFQGQGLGRALMLQALAWSVSGPGQGLERLELNVFADNTRAMQLYSSLGFQREGLRRAMVKESSGPYHDDVTMALLLGSSAGETVK